MSAWSSPARNVEVPELRDFFRPLSSAALGRWVEPLMRVAGCPVYFRKEIDGCTLLRLQPCCAAAGSLGFQG